MTRNGTTEGPNSHRPFSVHIGRRRLLFIRKGGGERVARVIFLSILNVMKIKWFIFVCTEYNSISHVCLCGRVFAIHFSIWIFNGKLFIYLGFRGLLGRQY